MAAAPQACTPLESAAWRGDVTAVKVRLDEGFEIRDGIVVVLKNATIPDGAHIGA